jgi:hypothetical protein
MSFFASVAGDEDSDSDKSSDCDDPDRSLKMFKDIETPEKNLDSHERSVNSHEKSFNSHGKLFQMFRDVITPIKNLEISSDDSHKYSLDMSSNIFRDINSIDNINSMKMFRDVDSPDSNVTLSNMSLGMFRYVDSIPSYDSISNSKFDFVKDRSSEYIQEESNDDNDLSTESQRIIDLEILRDNDKEEGYVNLIHESFSSKDDSNSNSNSSCDIFEDVNSPICSHPGGPYTVGPHTGGPHPGGLYTVGPHTGGPHLDGPFGPHPGGLYTVGPLTGGSPSVSPPSINRKNPSLLVSIPSNNSTPIKKPFTPSPRKEPSMTPNLHLTPSLRRNLTMKTPESITSKAIVPLIDIPSVKKPLNSPHKNLTIDSKTPKGNVLVLTDHDTSESINSKATVPLTDVPSVKKPWHDTWDIPSVKKPLKSPLKNNSSGVKPVKLTPRKNQVLKDLSTADCNTRNNNNLTEELM